MCRFSTATFDAFSTLGFIDVERYAKPQNWEKSVNQSTKTISSCVVQRRAAPGRADAVAGRGAEPGSALPTPASLVNFLVARVTH